MDITEHVALLIDRADTRNLAAVDALAARIVQDVTHHERHYLANLPTIDLIHTLAEHEESPHPRV